MLSFKVASCVVALLLYTHGKQLWSCRTVSKPTVIILYIGTLYVLGHLLFGKNNYFNDYINWDILRFQKISIIL